MKSGRPFKGAGISIDEDTLEVDEREDWWARKCTGNNRNTRDNAESKSLFFFMIR